MLFQLAVSSFVCLYFICSCESVYMYVYVWLHNIKVIIITDIKPANPYRLTPFYLSGNMPQNITSYFNSCSFSFERTGPLSYLTVLERELSQAKGSVIEVCWKPHQRTRDCAGCPGNTKAALRSHTTLLLWSLPACPCSTVSIGWAVDYLLAEDTNTKPNPNLGLDLRGETHSSSSPTVWYSLFYNPL